MTFSVLNAIATWAFDFFLCFWRVGSGNIMYMQKNSLPLRPKARISPQTGGTHLFETAIHTEKS